MWKRIGKIVVGLLTAVSLTAPLWSQEALTPVAAPTISFAEIGDGGDSKSIDSGSKEDLRKLFNEFLAEREKKKADAEKAAKQKVDQEGVVVGSNLAMTARWNHGVWFETANKDFKFHIGGRCQVDAIWMDTAPNVMFGSGGIGQFDDGVNFRRARITSEGTFWEVFNFNVEFEFLKTFDFSAVRSSVVTVPPQAPLTPEQQRALTVNTPTPANLWFEVTQLPIFRNVRVGNHKPWVGFEHMTSGRFLNFMERSYQYDSFIQNGDNGFEPGVSAWDYTEDECFAWQYGVFKTTRTSYGWNVGDGEWKVNARALWSPYYEEEGRYLVHTALGAWYCDLDDDTIRIRSRTALRNGPSALHTTVAVAQLTGDNQVYFNPEFVFQWGPLSIQSEYSGSQTNGVTRIVRTPAVSNTRISQRNYWAQGAYIEALYFLTGEHRDYDRKQGRFGRVIPFRNAFWVPGEGCKNLFSGGAWQVGVRYSYLDLDNAGIYGGEINSLTLGLNWFLNPNFKVQWNYELAHREIVNGTSSGNYQGAGVRFSFDF